MILETASLQNESSPMQVVDLGIRPYREVWDLQKEWVQKRIDDQCPDTLLVVEHLPVITLGRAALRLPQLLNPFEGTEVIEIERGGQATYHGPGQLVVYPICKLMRNPINPHAARSGVLNLIRALEQGMIHFLQDQGLESLNIPDKTGVWMMKTDRKIASIGIAVKRWVSYHGLAFNYATGTDVWKQLNPCGMSSDVMTDLSIESGQMWSRKACLESLMPYLLSALK